MKKIFAVVLMLLLCFSACGESTSSEFTSNTQEAISSFIDEGGSAVSTDSSSISEERTEEIRVMFFDLIIRRNAIFAWLHLGSQHDFDETLAPIYDEDSLNPEGFYWRAVNPYHTKAELRSALTETTAEAYSDLLILRWVEQEPCDFKEIDGRLYARIFDGSYSGPTVPPQNAVFDTFRIESVEEERIVVLCDAPGNYNVYEFELIWENERWVLSAWGGSRSTARTSSSTS